MVVGVPADFESRNQELSNDTKILLQDHFVRFGGKSALYVQTNKAKALTQVWMLLVYCTHCHVLIPIVS